MIGFAQEWLIRVSELIEQVFHFCTNSIVERMWKSLLIQRRRLQVCFILPGLPETG